VAVVSAGPETVMTKTLLIGIMIMAVVVGARQLAAEPQDPPALDPLIVAWDKGPDKIDVSKYPSDIKQKYKVFSDLCARCHTLARAINCDFAVEDDWERYIKRMMRRGKGLIQPAQAQETFDFAVYDSKIRKKELYERKLKGASR
jgi:hypothetical protein